MALLKLYAHNSTKHFSVMFNILMKHLCDRKEVPVPMQTNACLPFQLL